MLVKFHPRSPQIFQVLLFVLLNLIDLLVNDMVEIDGHLLEDVEHYQLVDHLCGYPNYPCHSDCCPVLFLVVIVYESQQRRGSQDQVNQQECEVSNKTTRVFWNTSFVALSDTFPYFVQCHSQNGCLDQAHHQYC